MPKAPEKLAVLNVGVTRYTRPLSATHQTKFARLIESSSLSEMHVVGLSSRARFERFQQEATFYLQPLVPSAGLRFLAVVARALIVGVKLGLAGRLHVLVCESPYDGLAGIMVRAILRACGRRVVVVTELHGDWEGSPFLYRTVPLRFLVEPVLIRWTKFVIRRSDLLRAVSRALEDQAAKLGAATTVAVFPTFTDFDLFLESTRPEPHPTPCILYVGGLYPIKGIDVLAEAFSMLINEGVKARLVIIGEGPYRDWLEDRVQPAEVRELVSFLGALPQTQVRREMLQARLLVLPSRSEGLPRVIMEAMASSLPVVATKVGGIPELVEDGSTGFLVPPDDASALAQRLRELVEDESKARSMGQRGRDNAEKELSSERYFEGYRNLFENARRKLDSVEG